MINLELTPLIKQWLDSDPADRSLEQGAELILKVTRNRILYTNITRNISYHADDIEYHLKKIYSQRLADITHDQVASLMVQVDAIAKTRHLDSSATYRSEFQRGKRADHDQLPPEIQQLYVDNAEIMHRMRDAHTKIRLITPENSTCPDSDRYPWAKYLVEQDTLYRDNWNKYDHYIKGSPVESVTLATDPRSDSKNAVKLCNLLLGKYALRPDNQLAARIKEAYSKIILPTEKLRSKMANAKLL